MKIKIPEVLTALFILFVSLYKKTSAYDYTIIRLFIGNIFIFLCAFYFLVRRRPFSAPLPILFPLTGFVLFTAISVGYSFFPPATLRELPHLLTYLLLFLAASQIYPTPFVIGFWIAATVILSFTGMYDYSQIQMVVTPLGNKNFFAGYLLLVIPVTITVLWERILALRAGITKPTPRPPVEIRRGKSATSLSARRRAPWQPEAYLSLALIVVLTLVTVLFLALLFLANSQAAFVGLAGGLLSLFFLSLGKFALPRFKSGSRILILSVLIIVLALSIFIGVKKGTPYVLKNVRYPLWKGSVNMIVKKPMTGFGPGAFLSVFQRFRPADYYNRPEVAPLSDHSHNEYLELASESGLPALFFFLIFLASILTLSARKMKNDRVIAKPKIVAISSEWLLLAGLISGLIALLIDGLFSTNLRTFSVASVFWVMLGFCVAIISAGSLKNHQVSNPKFPVRPAFIWIAVMAFSVFSAGLIIREVKGQVYYKEGITARNSQNWPGAISKYRKALELDPANLQAAYKLGFVYANANQLDEAINLYREILRISPNFAKTYYNLALLSLKSNDKDSAVTYLNLGLRYDPYDKEAQKVLNILTNPTANLPGSP